MENQIIVYQYDGQEIEFDLSDKNVMINATEMAKIFGETVEHFTRLDTTKAFVSECLKNPNMGFLGIQKKSDLIYSKQKAGTWMHRVLALKFAAWLNPAFELWVYYTIDKVLFATAKQIEETNRERAKIKAEMDKLRIDLLANDTFRRYELLQVKDKQYAYSMGKVSRNQLNMFLDQEKESVPEV